jgi:hypothetical protein
MAPTFWRRWLNARMAYLLRPPRGKPSLHVIEGGRQRGPHAPEATRLDSAGRGHPDRERSGT